MRHQGQAITAAHAEILSSVRHDPLNLRMPAQVRYALEVGCPPGAVADAVYEGLGGVLSTYWVALQEGNLRGDYEDYYRVVGMWRYIRRCYQERDRLVEFTNLQPEYFEMVGRMTSWER